MPISSSEIGQAIGAFQQQSFNNLSYSHAIGMGQFGQGIMADKMAGGAMNRAMGIGAPLASAGLGLMGLDPMSLGMRAGMGAWGAGGGALGAGMAGMGAFGAATGGLAAAGYVGNQVMMGGQQQAQLNSTLRSSFGFQNQWGGRGFGQSDMAQIGSQMRGMTHQFGPEGQVTSMSELTNIAGNMGKMGMMNGVRDAQEFSRKFKEMMTTLKTVARELGTSLEEAQQFMHAQKSAGVFSAANQMRFSGMARSTSVAGGLALSEVTGMASIGSQISRSVGGLGRSGAFGGMRAIGQVGSAMQVGAIDEESIYNATGLTGAEGRQAMAANMMSASGNFLKSGRGRHFLASIAGKNGQLDEASVQDWLTGGMDVGSTRAAGQKNLNSIGRANFIRNEGRLRGSALERFGALGQTMAYSQWLSGKGMDASNMDDRGMLAFQRFSGLGRDEADNAIAMVQKMPEMLEQQRMSSRQDERGQELGRYKQTHGIEGMKRKLEQVREGIQGKMQTVGQDIFNSTSGMIEGWFNKLMGITESRASADLDSLMNHAGLGGKNLDNLRSALGGNQKLGGGLGGTGIRDASMAKEFAAKTGFATASTKETSQFSKDNREWIREAYTSDLSKMNSESRIASFSTELANRYGKGDAKMDAMYKKWSSASPQERAGMLGTIEKEVGIGKGVSLGETWQRGAADLDRGKFSTVAEGDIAVGKSLLGNRAAATGAISGQKLSWWQQIMNGAQKADAWLEGNVDKASGGPWGEKNVGGSVLSGGEALSQAAGAYTRSERGGKLLRGLMDNDKGAMEEAQNRIMALNSASGGDASKLGAGDRAEMETLKTVSLGVEYNAIAQSGASGAKLNALVDKASKMLGRPVTEDELKGFHRGAQNVMGAMAIENIHKASGRLGDETQRNMQAYQNMGIGELKNGKLSLVAGKGGPGSDIIQAGLTAANNTAAALAAAGSDPAAQRDAIMEAYRVEGSQRDAISGMSISEKRAFAKRFAGSQEASWAGESTMREKRLKSAMGRGRGVLGGAASVLGIDIDKDELAGMKGADASKMAAFLAQKAGISDTAFSGELQKALEAAKSGKVGVGADALNKAVQGLTPEDRKKLGGKESPQEEMTSAIKAGNKFLESMSKDASNSLVALNSISGKIDKLPGGDPEKPKSDDKKPG